MNRFGTSLLLVAVVALAACDDAGPDHRPPPGEGGSVVETPERPTADEQTRSEPGNLPPLHPAVDEFPEARVELVGEDADVVLHVKLADTPERRQQGLMHVEDLPAGTGMLFVFDGETDGGFWMKNTLVPLDIAFADADGTIVDLLAMDPCEADPCEVYQPGASYTHALEVPQGWFAEVDVGIGDELRWARTAD